MTQQQVTGTDVQLEVDFASVDSVAVPEGAVQASPPARMKVPARRASGKRPARAKPRPAARGSAEPEKGEIATLLASKQREISVSEFFAKNRHLLGFDNPAKALLTTVKEAVDNALDACEDADLLPEILVQVTQVGEERFRVAVQDNGPGIVRNQVPKVFGKLLYGSKFHRLRQSRGQQGIGISAAGMYGLLTTGKPVVILSRTGSRSRAHHFELAINTKKNAPDILVDEEIDWDLPHGTRVEITLEGVYKKGRHSIEGYLKQVAVANPHATLIYEPPLPDEERVEYGRSTDQCPVQAKEIRPHPHGVELGVFLKMLQDTPARNLRAFLQSEFSRVGGKVLEDLAKELGGAAVTRPPSVYRGNPFQVEAGLAYGGELPAEELITLYRYANRVPLQYQQSGCAMAKGVIELPWRNYRISQSRGALPAAPIVLVIHIASVWVPFTSESKEAVAHYPEILREIRLALQECGRRLAGHISRHRRLADAHKKHSYIQKYIPHIGIALQEILGLTDKQREQTVATLTDVLEKSRGL
jgi:DNA topoisomerase-6 subunit B